MRAEAKVGSNIYRHMSQTCAVRLCHKWVSHHILRYVELHCMVIWHMQGAFNLFCIVMLSHNNKELV